MKGNSKGRVLVLDGLDRLREALDNLAEELLGWEFRMGPPLDERFPESAVLVEGYNKETKKHAAMMIAEENILDDTWEDMMKSFKYQLERQSGYDI